MTIIHMGVYCVEKPLGQKKVCRVANLEIVKLQIEALGRDKRVQFMEVSL